jgi:predicted CXXCH cytochrome family protein
MPPPGNKTRAQFPSRLLWSSVLAALIALTVALVLRRNPRSTVSQKPHNDSAYADPRECASCHQDVAATYARTGMGRSFALPGSVPVVEDYAHNNTLNHAASGLRYTMLQRDGAFFLRRSQTGFDGRETMEQRIDYIIGSGNHSRSYLHRAPDGQLIELPVSWYAEHGGSWAMSPGYDWKGQKDLRRAITPECMFCHNGYPQIDSSDPDLNRSIFPAALPEGIDCQRCHGPGRAHVKAARSGHATPELLRSNIVNPATLPRDRKLEVCMQCHLQTSPQQPNEQRLFDRTVFSYRPGEPLADYKLYFESTSANTRDDFEIAGAAYRLRRSACFRNSQMTCLTCHDPHDIPHGPEAAAQYMEVCLGCHRNVTHRVALPAGSTCISCHMPKRRTDDAVHVVMTDHFIQRTPPRRDLLAPIAEPQVQEGSSPQVAPYYPQKPPQTPAAELAIAEAQVGDQGIDRLRQLLERMQPSAPEPYLVLAHAYAGAGNEAEAAHWSEQALIHRPDFRPALVELVPALFALHRDAEATQRLEQAVARYPNDDLLLSDLGNAYLRQGDDAKAAAVLDRAFSANPDRSETHTLIGTLAMHRGDAATAEHEFREALRCQPNFSEAHDDLGSLLVQSHRYPEAAFHFEQAISSSPDDASAHHLLGRLLVLTDQLPRALAELREAARLQPSDAQTHEDLADLPAATGHPADAIVEYQRVLSLAPSQPQAQLGLGMTLLAEHRAAEARPHLDAATKGADAETAQTAAHLLQKMSR